MSRGLSEQTTAFRHLRESRFQALFFRSLSTMFGAGIPLVSCLEQLSEQWETDDGRQLAEQIAGRLREGQPIHRAMGMDNAAFSDLQLHLMKIGTQTGMLELIFRQLANYEEQRRALVLKLRSTLTYPCVVFGLSLVILMFLPAFAMDGLFSILENSGQELPLLTRVIIKWGDLLGSFWLYLVLFISVFVFKATVEGAWRADALRERVHEAMISVPVISSFLRLLTTLQFARCLHIQLLAGVNILIAVPLACKATSWEPTRRCGDQIIDYLKEGLCLSEALTRQSLFDSLLIEMIRAGEETGKLPYTLERSVHLYEQEVDYILSVAVGLLEPIMVGVLGVICATFVLGVALPLVQLLQVLA